MLRLRRPADHLRLRGPQPDKVGLDRRLSDEEERGIVAEAAFNHEEWQRHGLADFGEFADQISECYVGEDAFSGYGKWFFIPDGPLPSGDRVIYFGTWGNEHSPGASCHTHAEIFDMADADDAKAFERRVRDWESQPEYDENESEDWEEDDEQSDEEDIPF